MSSPGPARNGRPNNRTITAAAITTIAAIPNCGFTIAASPATAPAVAQRPRPASTSAAMSGRVPTASTCPQYGPAKIGPGESIQTAAERTATQEGAEEPQDVEVPGRVVAEVAGFVEASGSELRKTERPRLEGAHVAREAGRAHNEKAQEHADRDDAGNGELRPAILLFFAHCHQPNRVMAIVAYRLIATESAMAAMNKRDGQARHPSLVRASPATASVTRNGCASSLK